MADKPNFVMVPDTEPETEEAPPKAPSLFDHIRALLPFGASQVPATTPSPAASDLRVRRHGVA